MTNLQRIREIVTGLIIATVGVFLLILPRLGYMVILVCLYVIYTIRGISQIVYYFTMARYMVGGRSSLFKGVIMLDFGILTGALTDVPHVYILLYLIAMHAFTGGIEILRAREARGYGARSWRLKLFHGIVDMTFAILCIIFFRQESIAGIIYGIGLIYSALLRIVGACRRTDIVYIQ